MAQWLPAEVGEDSGAIYRTSFDALTLHQSIGLTVLLLAVIRLAWRSLIPKPAWPADMKSYEITLARAVHFAYYVLLFAIPIAGWALSSVEDEPLRFFGFEAPRIVLAGEETLEEVHEVLFNIFVSLGVIHVVGAASIGSPAEYDAETPSRRECPRWGSRPAFFANVRRSTARLGVD